MIEQEAAIDELDAGDMRLIWSLMGGEQRYETGLVDALVEDDVELLKQEILDLAAHGVSARHRSERVQEYRSRLAKIDPAVLPDSWGMPSAARYPVVLFGSVPLPFILRTTPCCTRPCGGHTVLAYLLFLAFLAHFGAILFHTLIVRDGMLLRMVPWTVLPREVVRGSGQPTSRSERVEE